MLVTAEALNVIKPLAYLTCWTSLTGLISLAYLKRSQLSSLTHQIYPMIEVGFSGLDDPEDRIYRMTDTTSENVDLEVDQWGIAVWTPPPLISGPLSVSPCTNYCVERLHTSQRDST